MRACEITKIVLWLQPGAYFRMSPMYPWHSKWQQKHVRDAAARSTDVQKIAVAAARSIFSHTSQVLLFTADDTTKKSTKMSHCDYVYKTAAKMQKTWVRDEPARTPRFDYTYKTPAKIKKRRRKVAKVPGPPGPAATRRPRGPLPAYIYIVQLTECPTAHVNEFQQ